MRLSNYIDEQKVLDIEQHLRDRGLDPNKTNILIDKESNIAVFLLYNLSGVLVGYQQYNPNGTKNKVFDKTIADKDMMKYYTYLGKENDEKKVKKIGVYGLHTYNRNSPVLFVVEGIFDAVKLHNLGLPAIATLSNDPKPFGQWLKLLPQKIIIIMDNDSSGNKLAKFGDKSVKVPNPWKDLGEMTNDQVRDFLKRERLI